MLFIEKFKGAIRQLLVTSALLLFAVSILFVSTPALASPQTDSQSAETSAPITAPTTEEITARSASCDGSNPATYNPDSIKTVKTAGVHGRQISLRYHTSARCAWGKIANGSAGDGIWVDRSFDGGRTWQSKLGNTKINSGTQKYTLMFDDAGKKMRACGKAGNRSEIACTSWY